MYNYWRELYCKFLQGYLKPRLNKLPKEKKIINFFNLKKKYVPFNKTFRFLDPSGSRKGPMK